MVVVGDSAPGGGGEAVGDENKDPKQISSSKHTQTAYTQPGGSGVGEGI